jgi:alkylhydroperoxidase family enzyme
MDERAELLRAVGRAVLDGAGALDPALRRSAFQRGGGDDAAGLPEPLGGFVDTVARRAYQVTDADVAALHAAGYGDDAVLEAVLATAVGAGLSRLETGLAALRGEG